MQPAPSLPRIVLEAAGFYACVAGVLALLWM
jgi:hypothetical protein